MLWDIRLLNVTTILVDHAKANCKSSILTIREKDQENKKAAK